MPLRDGTGPFGRGPGSGRGRGKCTGFISKNIFRSAVRGRQGWLFGIVVPIVTVVIRDLLNPSGVLRRIAHASSAPKITSDARKTRRNAEFTVINADSVPIVHRKKTSE